MSKKKFISSKVVLRSLAGARHIQQFPHSYIVILCGIGLCILGWFLITHPDWIINTLLIRF